MDRNGKKQGNPATEPAMLTIPQMARELSISRALAYRLVRSQEIRSYRVTDRAIRVSRSDLAAWLASKED